MQPAEVVDAGNGRQNEERSCHCPDEGLRRFEIYHITTIYKVNYGLP
jgi:hypothetical protein